MGWPVSLCRKRMGIDVVGIGCSMFWSLKVLVRIRITGFYGQYMLHL